MNAREMALRVEEIWLDILPETRSARDATFFELGGQSVSAIRIVTDLEEQLDIEVDVAELFEDPTLDAFIDTVLDQAGYGPTAQAA